MPSTPKKYRLPSQGRPSWVKWLIIAVVAVVIPGCVWYFSARGNDDTGQLPYVAGTDMSIKDYPYSGDVASGTPPFSELPVSVQLDAVAPFVNANVQKWYVDYQKRIKKSYGPKVDSVFVQNDSGTALASLPPVAADNTAHEIVLRHLAITHGRWNNVEPALAKFIVSAQAMPGSIVYDQAVLSIDQRRGSLMDPMATSEASALPMFTEGSFNGVEAKGKPTRVVLLNGSFINVYQLHGGVDNADVKAWLLMDAGSMGDPIGAEYRKLVGVK